MRKLLVILLLLSGITYAQTNLDSLWAVWQDESLPDTSRLNAINKFEWAALVFSKPDSAYALTEIEYQLAKEKKLPKFMARALNTQGTCFWVKSDYDNALNRYEKSVAISEKINDLKALSGSLNNLGAIYYVQGKYSKAIEIYTRCLEIAKEVNNQNNIAMALINLGNIYRDQGSLKKAIENYESSLKIAKKLKNKGSIATVLGNLGIIHRTYGDSLITEGDTAKAQAEFELAYSYFDEALQYYIEEKDLLGIGGIYNNIGTIFQSQKNYTKAIEAYMKSLESFESAGEKRGISNSLANIGICYSKQRNYAKSISFSERALALATEVGSILETRDAALWLYKDYKALNKYSKSLEMFELYIKMRDSVMNEANSKAMIRQQFKYDYDKKEALAKKEHELELQRQEEIALAEKKRQNIIISSVSIGLGIVILFSIFLFNRFRVTRKQKVIIEKQKQEVDTAYNTLEQKNKEITDSINYAKRIQGAILPPGKVVKKYLPHSFIIYKPKDIVAGDFYWLEHKDGKVLFAAADCTGHGVPGAMVSVVCNNGLNRSVREYGLIEPGKILDKTREIVIAEFEKSEEEVKDGMDIALCSLEGNKLQYAGANNPLWIIRNNELIEIKADKQPIGKYAENKSYTTHNVALQKGDSIYIFTDGYVDQFGGEKSKKYKASNFKKLLLSIQEKSMEEQKNTIEQNFKDWKGNLEQIDDVCVIGVRV